MDRSRWKLALAVFGTILFLQGAAGLAAAPELPETPEAPADAVDGVDTAGVEAPLCAEKAATILDLERLEQTGQPCCQTLCEQTCGVGEPCACKRCVVLGCGL